MLAIAVLGPFGIAGAAVGCYDAFVAGLSGPDRLSAFALLLAGLTTTAGAAALVRVLAGLAPATEIERTIILLGAMSALLTALFLLATTFNTPGAVDVPRAILTCVAIVSAACVWWFRFGTRLTAVRIGSTFLAVLGTVAGVAQYAYANDLAASSLTHTFELEAHLAKAGSSGGMEVVRASVTVTNSGGTAAVSVGSAYAFTGAVAYPCAKAASLKTIATFFNFSVPDPQALRYSRYVKLAPARLLAAGKVLGDGVRLEPGQVVKRSYLFFARPDAFQVLAMRAQVFAIPAGAISLGTSTSDFMAVHNLRDRTHPHADGDLYVFWRVREHSLLRTLLAGPDRWLVVRYELSQAPGAPTHTNTALRATARLTPRSWSPDHPSPLVASDLFPTLSAVASASEPFGDDELLGAPLPRTTPPSVADDARNHGCPLSTIPEPLLLARPPNGGVIDQLIPTDDGQHVVYRARAGTRVPREGIWIADAAGRQPVLLSSPNAAHVRLEDRTGDGRYVLWNDGTQDALTATATGRQVGLGAGADVSLRPDGSALIQQPVAIAQLRHAILLPGARAPRPLHASDGHPLGTGQRLLVGSGLCPSAGGRVLGFVSATGVVRDRPLPRGTVAAPQACDFTPAAAVGAAIVHARASDRRQLVVVPRDGPLESTPLPPAALRSDAVRLSPSGRYVTVVAPDRFTVFSLHPLRSRLVVRMAATSDLLDWSPDERTLVVGGRHVVAVPSGSQHLLSRPPGCAGSALWAWLPDGGMLVRCRVTKDGSALARCTGAGTGCHLLTAVNGPLLRDVEVGPGRVWLLGASTWTLAPSALRARLTLPAS